jgi:hypothetical protein
MLLDQTEVEPMFFLMRCVFWLGIVFSAMFWMQNDPKSAGSGANETASWSLRHSLLDGQGLAFSSPEASVQGLAGVGEKVQLFCVKSPATCLAAVEKLQQIVAEKPVPAPQSDASNAADAALPGGGSAVVSEVPRPPRRPGKLGG